MRPITLGDTTRRWLLRAGGAALVLVAMLVTFSTERADVQWRATLARHGGAVVDLGHLQDARPDLDGRMVRITGTPRVVEAPYDADFNQQAATPVLTRHVAMFQWRELLLGNQPTYELDWAETPQDTLGFKRPGGHENPGAFPIHRAQFVAGRVRLGPYTLGSALVRMLPGSEPMAPNAGALPANLAATFVVHDQALVTSARPGAPRLGDLRVSWTMVPAQEVTVLARIEGDHLVAVPNAANGPGYEVNVGDSPLLAMRPDTAAAPQLIWLRRVLALLLAVAGIGLATWRSALRAGAPLAVGGGLLVTGVAAALPWFGVSMAAVIGWFALAALGAAGVWWWRRTLNTVPKA